MKVYYSVDDIPAIKNPVLTLGTFDGVHLGHQQIIAFLKESAAKIDGETVLFTFHPHPRMVLHPEDHGMKLIQTIDERIEKLSNFGIDHLILFPFTVNFSRMSATEFVRDVLVNKVNIKLMTIGYNHHFGRNREGNLGLLNELGITYGFEVQEIPAFRKADIDISSTKIRTAIEEGNIKKANQFLGNYFSFNGNVVKGDQLGTEIGYPTANLTLKDKNQLIPAQGVYAVRASVLGKTYNGMMNIGTRPTVSDTQEKRIEVNLFDFDDTIYGQEVHIEVHDHVRKEQQFDSLNALKEQLKHDKTHCITLLGDAGYSK